MGQHVLPGVAIPEAGKFPPSCTSVHLIRQRGEGGRGWKDPILLFCGETLQKQLKKRPFPLQKSARCGARRGTWQLGKGTAHRDGGH